METRYKVGDRVRKFPHGTKWATVVSIEEFPDEDGHPIQEVYTIKFDGSVAHAESSEHFLISVEESLAQDEGTIWTWFQPDWLNTQKPRPKLPGDGPYQFTGEITDDYFDRDKFFIKNRELNGYYDHMRWGDDAFHTKEEAVAHEYLKIREGFSYHRKKLREFEEKYADFFS